jgi:large subunit ribosomal protein L23
VKANRNIIIRPLITEKMSAMQEDLNKVAFVVDWNANKIEIRKAVEDKFNVKVNRVTTMRMEGKLKRMGRFQGKRSNWKKAIVTLADGFSIDFFEGK